MFPPCLSLSAITSCHVLWGAPIQSFWMSIIVVCISCLDNLKTSSTDCCHFGTLPSHLYCLDGVDSFLFFKKCKNFYRIYNFYAFHTDFETSSLTIQNSIHCKFKCAAHCVRHQSAKTSTFCSLPQQTHHQRTVWHGSNVVV